MDLYGTAGMSAHSILLMSVSHLFDCMFFAAQATLCVIETLFLQLPIKTSDEMFNNKYDQTTLTLLFFTVLQYNITYI